MESNKVSVYALRILPYLILIKAITSAAMFLCMAVAGFGVNEVAPYTLGFAVAFCAIQMVDFLDNIVCAMCFGGLIALSPGFISAQKAVVWGLVTDCLMILVSGAGMSIKADGLEAMTHIGLIKMVLVITAHLLLGAAVIFMIRGYKDALAPDGDRSLINSFTRIGNCYLFLIVADVILTPLIRANEGSLYYFISALLYLSFAVMECIIYRRVSDASFRIWRRRAFWISEGWSVRS